MIRFRPLPLMTIFAILSVGILVWLGRWQWERFDEKSALANEPVAEMTIASYQPIEAAI
jgi:surfeit locus 1 family protein